MNTYNKYKNYIYKIENNSVQNDIVYNLENNLICNYNLRYETFILLMNNLHIENKPSQEEIDLYDKAYTQILSYLSGQELQCVSSHQDMHLEYYKLLPSQQLILEKDCKGNIFTFVEPTTYKPVFTLTSSFLKKHNLLQNEIKSNVKKYVSNFESIISLVENNTELLNETFVYVKDGAGNIYEINKNDIYEKTIQPRYNLFYHNNEILQPSDLDQMVTYLLCSAEEKLEFKKAFDKFIENLISLTPTILFLKVDYKKELSLYFYMTNIPNIVLYVIKVDKNINYELMDMTNLPMYYNTKYKISSNLVDEYQLFKNFNLSDTPKNCFDKFHSEGGRYLDDNNFTKYIKELYNIEKRENNLEIILN